MPNLTNSRMNADRFLAWARGRDGRMELHDGAVVAPRPATMGHELTRSRAHATLRDAILRAGSSCRVHLDGPALRVNAGNVFSPDVVVTLGPAAHDAVELADPVIVVEVLSAGTAAIDAGPKFEGYFSLPTVAHYLIIDPERRVVIHHERGARGRAATSVRDDGHIRLTPPGLMIATMDMFAPA